MPQHRRRRRAVPRLAEPEGPSVRHLLLFCNHTSTGSAARPWGCYGRGLLPT